MVETKPAKETPAWLLTADRYMAEIAAAERVEALAAAAARASKASAVPVCLPSGRSQPTSARVRSPHRHPRHGLAHVYALHSSGFLHYSLDGR